MDESETEPAPQPPQLLPKVLARSAQGLLAIVILVAAYFFFVPVVYFSLEAGGLIDDNVMSNHLNHWLRPIQWAYEQFPIYSEFINTVRMPLVGR